MKKIILILFLYSLSFSISEAQWIRQLSPGHFITDVEFINRNTGWACGNNAIYKTTNGGQNWINQPNPSTYLIMQIHPVNDSVVYAAGWWNFLKTTNGGDNWISIFSGEPGMGMPALDAIFFINENTGWLAGQVVYLKTTDGGNSFIDSGRIEGSPKDIFFKNENEGIMSGVVASVFRTTNGGTNWIKERLIQQGSQYDFFKVSFINDSVGFIGGEIVFKTTNFGLTWDSVGSVPFGFEQSYCIEFADEHTGYSGGTAGTLFKTTNGGGTWVQFQGPEFGQGFYRSIYAYNDSIVWAVGNAKIIFTENGGLTNTEQLSSSVPDEFKLYQNFPNPFNSKTKIRFDLLKSGEVKLEIFDALGRKVSTLLNERKQPGTYEVLIEFENLNSGVYFYRLSSDNKSLNMKMLLIK
ncbi:MAG: T9SS type A sorting domain-containing protein [Bacteroidetes bacterium]|nr:T9SS type A sorting domain-containing protein [Bacteroidota bacterium]